jgi:hypothetical protein
MMLLGGVTTLQVHERQNLTWTIGSWLRAAVSMLRLAARAAIPTSTELEPHTAGDLIGVRAARPWARYAISYLGDGCAPCSR